MQVLEIISVRLYDANDRDQVIGAFNRIRSAGLRHKVSLYREAATGCDWLIQLRRSFAAGGGDKCPEALCLAELLRSIGLVHHVVWLPELPH